MYIQRFIYLAIISFCTVFTLSAQQLTDTEVKLKAAHEAALDTAFAFKEQMRNLRLEMAREQVFAENATMKTFYERLLAEQRLERAEIRQIYRPLPQQISPLTLETEIQRMDSIYEVLKQCPDNFKRLMEQYSAKKESYTIGRWCETAELEQCVDTLDKGEISLPFFTPQGLHIVEVLEPWHNLRYNEVQKDLIQRLHIIPSNEVETLKGEYSHLLNEDKSFADKMKSVEDSVLCEAIMQKVLTEYSSPDSVTLQQYYKKNIHRYKWDSPRFKGLALRCTNKKTYKMVRKFFKKLPESEWNNAIRLVVERDSLTEVVASPAYYSKGENPFIDEKVFGAGRVEKSKTYPYLFVIGDKRKYPDGYQDVCERVFADYMAGIEQRWLDEQRRRYSAVK